MAKFNDTFLKTLYCVNTLNDTALKYVLYIANIE